MNNNRAEVARRNAEGAAVEHICSLLTRAVESEDSLKRAIELAKRIVDSYEQQSTAYYQRPFFGVDEDIRRFTLAGLFQRDVLLPLDRELGRKS